MSDLAGFAENVWIVEGPSVRDFGIMWTTRMIVVRLSDGSLWVDSPVPVPFDTLTRITALGPVRHLVAATPRHVWRLAYWHELFPEAELWLARGTPLTLKKGRLPFPYVLGDVPPEAWAEDLDQIPFKGNPLIEETIFFHKKSRTKVARKVLSWDFDKLIVGHGVCVERDARPFVERAFRWLSQR